MNSASMLRIARKNRVHVYVWEWPVRILHWTLFACILILCATGFYIGWPYVNMTGASETPFLMGTVKLIHLYAAIVFTLCVLSRFAWMFLGNRYASWKQFVPINRERWRNLRQTLGFYLFLRHDPPPHVGHNALAGAAYILLFAEYLLMILTGFAMYSANAHVEFPMGVFQFLGPLFGGLQTARWLHHIGMYLILMFAAHHVFAALEVSAIEKNSLIGSMISGWKLLKRENLPRDVQEELRP